MDQKQLKKLSRLELLELLTEKSRECDALRAELAEARKQLASRKILIEETGSIAEAALKLNGVFEAAQAAADQYLANMRVLTGWSTWDQENNPNYSSEISFTDVYVTNEDTDNHSSGNTSSASEASDISPGLDSDLSAESDSGDSDSGLDSDPGSDPGLEKASSIAPSSDSHFLDPAEETSEKAAEQRNSDITESALQSDAESIK